MNCAARKRIFDGSWVTCLRTYCEPTAAAGERNTTASAPSRPFLVPPKLTASTPASIVIARSADAGASEGRGGIGDAGTVEVDEHAERVGLIAECGDLVRAVQRAEFGRLRDRDDARLCVVLDALRVGDLGELVGDAAWRRATTRSISLVASARSGAPVSSTAMWAQSVQTTAWFGPGSEPSNVASATMLAPVPLNVRRVVTSAPKRSRNRSVHSRVCSSSP